MNELKARIEENEKLIASLKHKISSLKKKQRRIPLAVPRFQQAEVITQQQIIPVEGPKGPTGDVGQNGLDGEDGVFNPATLYYGPGIDGNVLIDSDQVLDSDLYCKNLTIAEGANLRTNDYIIHVNNRLIIEENASIHNDGNKKFPLRFSGCGGNEQKEAESCHGMGGNGGSAANSNNGGKVRLNPSYLLPMNPYFDDDNEVKHRQFGAGGGGYSTALGGNGAGSLIIYAKIIENQGILSACGENGQDDLEYGAGGGGGGFIGLIYDQYTGGGKIYCNGGNGGKGGIADGESGGDGILICYNNSIGLYES